MKRARTAAAALALVALISPFGSRYAFAQAAQPAQAADAGPDAARTLYSAGAAAYAAGNFAAAVQALGQAYALSPRPGILFSLAQAERQLYTLEHDPAELRAAMDHYRAYIQQTPQGGRRADAVEVLGELEVEAARTGRPLDERASDAPDVTKPVVHTRIMVSVDAKDPVSTLDATRSTAAKSVSVSVDGVEVRDLPAIVETSPGPHVVTTRASGYFDDTRTIVGVEGSLVVTEVTLRERPARVRLEVPAGAEITLDGRPHGSAPIADLEVAGGSHAIGLSLPGRVPELRTFTLERGGSLVLTAALRTTVQRKVSYGLFAGSGVALLAGGVAAVAALVFESDAKGIQSEASLGNITSSQLDSYNRSLDRRDAWRTASMVSLGVGAAMAATAAILFAADHAHPELPVVMKESARSPAVRPGESGLVVQF